MANLINFFFSFDKLMKEKLIIAFYWLAIIVLGLNYFSEALSAIKLGWLAKVVEFVNFFGGILLTLVALRLLCEIAVAIFRINNNLSPDGGKSETADIDPIAEARKAAEQAANRAREVSKSAIDKTKSATHDAKESVNDFTDATVAKAKSATTHKKPSGEDITISPTDPVVTKARATVKKATPKPAAKKPPVKKTTAKSTSTTPKKRGPKPGTKRAVGKDGVRLKKDGTPAKKPGPKKD